MTQGYQTTGQGNENALLLRMDVTPLKNITNTTLIVTLDATTQQNISSLYVYETTATEFIANIPSTKLATADDISGTVNINLGDVSSGLHHYWLCATVKDDATLGDILDAALTSITYTTTEEKTLDVSEIGNPTRQGMKVFAQQNFVFKPTADNCRFYRIPAMILDKNGNVVVAIDRRYNSNADLGSHKIDVSVVRSTNAGKTWSNQNIVAVGNTSIEERYGFSAMEMTSSEIIERLTAAGDQQSLDELRQLFTTADLVKFAKYSTMINENDANLVSAIDFINQTKLENQPVEEVQKPVLSEADQRSQKERRVLKIVIWGIVSVAVLLFCYIVYSVWQLLV